MDNNTVPVSKLHVPCWHLGHGWQPLPQCNGIQSLQFAPVYLYAHVHTSGRTHNPWPLQLFTVLQHDKVIYNCTCTWTQLFHIQYVVLSVLLRFVASYYPFDIFKRFLIQGDHHGVTPNYFNTAYHYWCLRVLFSARCTQKKFMW